MQENRNSFLNELVKAVKEFFAGLIILFSLSFMLAYVCNRFSKNPYKFKKPPQQISDSTSSKHEYREYKPWEYIVP